MRVGPERGVSGVPDKLLSAKGHEFLAALDLRLD
jgi:hypothetical protein